MGLRLIDYLDKGASLDPDAPCLTTDGESASYAEVRELAGQVAGALAARGIAPGDKVAILSANDPVAFTCVFGISAAGAVWCPVNPRNEAGENRELLELFECRALLFQRRFAPLVAKIAPDLPRLALLVCLDRRTHRTRRIRRRARHRTRPWTRTGPATYQVRRPGRTSSPPRGARESRRTTWR